MATAGHVDHGKSTLVRALTGTDPDRLAEARRRGMTLDLGYATCALPSGRTLSLVDVPGHERYVGNALCGLAPVRAVLLVVAADAGWQRQTSEHVDAVDALGIGHVVLTVTRSDLADPAPVLADALARLAGLATAQCVEAVTTPGVDDLAAALDRCLDRLPVPDPDADVRLWLDRSFDVRGRGRVVTGTLEAGTLRVGDRLVTAAGEAVRVRGLQVHGADAEVVSGPARVAVAVAVPGRAATAGAGRSGAALHRGDALLGADRWHRTDVVDVRLSAPLPARPAQLVLHVGTAAVPVRVRPLGPDHARLTLPAPLPLRVGDRAVLRDPGAHRVLCGAVVVDVAPLPLTRRGAAAARAHDLAVSDPLALALARGPQRLTTLTAQGLALPADPPVPVSTPLAAATDRPAQPRLGSLWSSERPLTTETATDRRDRARLGSGSAPERPGSTETAPATPPTTPPTADADPVVRVGDWVTTDDHLHALGDQLKTALGDLPPTAPGLATTAAAARLGITPELLPAVAERAGATTRPGLVVNPRHSFGPADAAVRALAHHLASDPLGAPDRGELRQRGLDAKALATAHAHGILLRLAPDVVVHPTAPERAVRVLAGVPQPFSPGEAARALGASRRVVVPLLEHLDATGWTTREGSLRQVRSPAAATGVRR